MKIFENEGCLLEGGKRRLLQFQDYVLLVLMLVALYTDIRYNKLPNWLTVSGVAFGLVYHLIAGGIDGLLFSGIGFLVATGIFLLLYVFRVLSAGDVKLFAAFGAIAGTEVVLHLMMYSIVFGGIIGIVILLFTRTFLSRVTGGLFAIIGSITSKDLSHLEDYKVNRSTRIPFMYAVAPAVFTTYYFLVFA